MANPNLRVIAPNPQQHANEFVSGDAARLVPVLFPNQHPQLHVLDRY